MGSLASNHTLTRMFTTFWHHRSLITQLIKRDILNKYRGSFIGLLWLLLSPVLMLALYTIVFGVFVHVRWPGVDNNLMYALLVYVGLIIFNLFSDCLGRSPGLIVSNANFVKKIVFPIEIYPLVIMGSSLFYALINTFILALFCLVLLGKIHLTLLFLPLLWLPLIFITLGTSWFLCSIGVYIRDISLAMGFIMQVIMYLSPVFYATSLLPQAFQKALLLNPLTWIIEQTRRTVIFGDMPQWSEFSLYFCISILIAWLGFIWFQKTRDGFADVL